MSKPNGRLYLYSKFEYSRDPNTGRRHLVRAYAPNGCLYSGNGRISKFRKEDMPEWYVAGCYWKQHGFLNAKGVKDVLFVPSNPLYNDHALKDCCLYVSYTGSITFGDSNFWPSFDHYDILFGNTEIVDFLLAAERWSGLDISLPLSSVEQHLGNFAKIYPDQTWVQDYLAEIKERGAARTT